MANKRRKGLKGATAPSKALASAERLEAAGMSAASSIPAVTVTGPKTVDFDYGMIIGEIVYEQSGDFAIDLRQSNEALRWTLEIQRSAGYKTTVILPPSITLDMQDEAIAWCSGFVARLEKVLAFDATRTIDVGLTNDESFARSVITRAA